MNIIVRMNEYQHLYQILQALSVQTVMPTAIYVCGPGDGKIPETVREYGKYFPYLKYRGALLKEDVFEFVKEIGEAISIWCDLCPISPRFIEKYREGRDKKLIGGFVLEATDSTGAWTLPTLAQLRDLGTGNDEDFFQIHRSFLSLDNILLTKELVSDSSFGGDTQCLITNFHLAVKRL